MKPRHPKDGGRYADLFDLPHPDPPAGRARMPRSARAAQFAPFAALNGHDDAIREAARVTDAPAVLDAYAQAALDRRLRLLRTCLSDRPEDVFTFFQPDACKPGGAYRTVRGRLVKIDEAAGVLVLADRTRIPIAALYRIEGALFRDWE